MLSDHSRCPKRSPSKTSYDVKETIISTRERLREKGFQCGSRSIVNELEGLQFLYIPSISTVNRILRRNCSGEYSYKAGKGKRVSSRHKVQDVDGCQSSEYTNKICNINLCDDEKRILDYWARSTTTKAGLAKRSAIILMIDSGKPVSEIAKKLCVSRTMVYKWIKRFQDKRLEGLRRKKPDIIKKYEDESIKSEVFSMLHSPPPQSMVSIERHGNWMI